MVNALICGEELVDQIARLSLVVRECMFGLISLPAIAKVLR
jgi:hypothetical protein